MADKPTGPVKPPTLDMTARKAETPKDDATKSGAVSSGDNTAAAPATPSTDPRSSADAKPASETKQASGPKPATGPISGQSAGAQADRSSRARDTVPTGALIATGVAGAIAGLGLAYGLAAVGFWPAQTPVFTPQQLSALEARIARTENTLEIASNTLAGLGADVETIAATTAPQALPENLVTSETIDPLVSRIEALGLRLDAVAAGMPGDESAQLADEIARLGTAIETIEAERADTTTADTIATLEETLSTLVTRIATLEAQSADQASVEAARAERDRFAQIPPATAALETAIAAGAPFGGELARIEALLPELGITNPARAIAASGVPPTREIARDFRALIPQLLAARPQDPEAGWLDTLMGQAQSVIALRPVDAQDNSPEAILGRIETALESGNATAARTLILELPDPMQAVAAPVRSDLDAVIAAQGLVADIRALAPRTSDENGENGQ